MARWGCAAVLTFTFKCRLAAERAHELGMPFYIYADSTGNVVADYFGKKVLNFYIVFPGVAGEFERTWRQMTLEEGRALTGQVRDNDPFVYLEVATTDQSNGPLRHGLQEFHESEHQLFQTKTVPQRGLVDCSTTLAKSLLLFYNGETLNDYIVRVTEALDSHHDSLADALQEINQKFVLEWCLAHIKRAIRQHANTNADVVNREFFKTLEMAIFQTLWETPTWAQVKSIRDKILSALRPENLEIPLKEGVIHFISPGPFPAPNLNQQPDSEEPGQARPNLNHQQPQAGPASAEQSPGWIDTGFKHPQTGKKMYWHIASGQFLDEDDPRLNLQVSESELTSTPKSNLKPASRDLAGATGDPDLEIRADTQALTFAITHVGERVVQVRVCIPSLEKCGILGVHEKLVTVSAPAADITRGATVTFPNPFHSTFLLDHLENWLFKYLVLWIPLIRPPNVRRCNQTVEAAIDVIKNHSGLTPNMAIEEYVVKRYTSFADSERQCDLTFQRLQSQAKVKLVSFPSGCLCIIGLGIDASDRCVTRCHCDNFMC